MNTEKLLQETLAYLARGDAPSSKFPDRRGEYWTLCPFHDDHHASNFSVSERGYKCFACDAEGGLQELAAHLGINGHRPQRQRNRRFDFDRIVGRWSYHSANGVELYEVLKDASKNFMPVHQAAGGRKGGYPAAGRVLYRLPEVLEAETVYLTEGEKSVEAVRALGLTATTIPGGARGRWFDAYTEALEDRHVVILPDNDKAGEALVREATQELRGRAASVKVAEIPGLSAGEDIEDFIDRGNGREDIEGLELRTVQDNAEPAESPSDLLDIAVAIDDYVARAKVMGRFCDAIASLPAIEQDGWIEAAKAAGVANKTTLRRQLDEVGSGSEPPGQRELRDRWLTVNPDIANTVRWREYSDGWWPIIERDTVKRRVTRVLEDAEDEGVELTSYLVNQVFDLVQIETFVDPDTWDADTSILVCKNGTLDLDTLTLREHSKGDYSTGAVPYEYDPHADCPTFRYVVARAAGDAAYFLQEFAGYALTTDTHLETAVWLKGERGGGKSTIIEGLQAMLGERCGTLGIAQVERSRFGLSSIVGKTLVVASDQPGNYISASNILNNIISGEKVKVEAKFQDPVDIRPRAKIMWSMNSLPRIKEGNNGIFRRVKVVEVPPLPREERDPDVKELVKAEGPGILNWALEGLRRLRGRGRFELPSGVERATDLFQLENDKPRMFAEEELVFGEGHKVKASALYSAYRQWCLDNGYQPRARQKLKQDWQRLGLQHKAERDANYYHGAGLLAT